MNPGTVLSIAILIVVVVGIILTLPIWYMTLVLGLAIGSLARMVVEREAQS